MSSEELGEMFLCDFADKCAESILLVSMEGQGIHQAISIISITISIMLVTEGRVILNNC